MNDWEKSIQFMFQIQALSKYIIDCLDLTLRASENYLISNNWATV